MSQYNEEDRDASDEGLRDCLSDRPGRTFHVPSSEGLIRVFYTRKSNGSLLMSATYDREVEDTELTATAKCLSEDFDVPLDDIVIELLRQERKIEPAEAYVPPKCSECGSEIIGMLTTSCSNRECRRWNPFAFEYCLRCGQQRLDCAC